MTRLLLVRHGSTAWNAQRRYQGQSDTTLSEVGQDQVKHLAERLRTEGVDALYASDLRRAWETAERIAAHHQVAIRPEPRLREISFGDWEGKTHEQIEADDSKLLAQWYDDPMHTSPPGGETLQEVEVRVEAALDTIVQRHPEETTVVVAHGGTLRVVICIALGLPLESYWQFDFDLASLSELNVYDEGAILKRLNDTGHLRRCEKSSHEAVDEPARATGKLTLVLGGARSGKSDFAQEMAGQMGKKSVLFVATAEAGDREMERRIQKHRDARPPHWHTLEAPRDVGRAILDLTAENSFEVVLVDCMTLLASNLLVDVKDPFVEEVEANLMREVEGLIGCAAELPASFIVVSNEVGCGVVPPYPLGRAYRDLLGRANKTLAEAADEVILLVAGIPRTIKSAS